MKKMFTLALVVAAMMSASVSASAHGRKAELVKVRKGDVRKEIRFHQRGCPASAFDKRFLRFDSRFDQRARFDKFAKFDKFARPDKFAKHRRHRGPHRL